MQNMFASQRGLTSLLALIPYLLLWGLIWITQTLLWLDAAQTAWLWELLRWLIRLLLIGGACWGWRQTTHGQRPLWWYSWLGFATYEVVGLLLMGVVLLMSRSIRAAPNAVVLGLPLGVLAFLPYVVVAIGVARRDRWLALFTIWPHAALTAPLFFMAMGRFISPELDPTMLSSLALPLVVASASIALLTWRQPRQSWFDLYASMAASQGAVPLAVAWDQGQPMLMFVALPLVIMGAVILSGPLFLLPLWRFLIALIERHATGALGVAWAQRRRALVGKLMALLAPLVPILRQPTVSSSQLQSGGLFMSESISTSAMVNTAPAPGVGPGLERLYKLAVVLLAAVIVGALILFIGRSAVYKIHEYERGLHLRGGRFQAVQEPGWHLQIPLVDTVIIVKVNERLGYIERIEAMTSDNVTMFVSLQYTYRVTDPQQYALQVDDPERIVFEFVQGRLRDVVNTKAMTTVMNDRAMMNQEVVAALREKEGQYGVQFATVQLQSASPPDEVLSAIKDRMVAAQRQEQAQAEAAQQKTIADAELYTAQKRAEAAAYEIAKKAEADAERIRLTTEAEQLAIRSVLAELEGKGELANKFLDYLIAQQLKDNSKWIINGESAPIVNLE
jgi:regulator of protease activity HflC (stomatin/prohibitin superfamily)